MDYLKISLVSINDITKLQFIGKQTFFEAFSFGGKNKNVQNYVDKTFTIENLSSELTNPNSKFYFAIINSEVVGYLKLNMADVQKEFKNINALEIERIYVLKNYYGKNIGQALLKKSIQIAKEQHVDFMWLSVWLHNARAIKFYKKNGFVESGSRIFKLGDEEQLDIVMKLNMKCPCSNAHTEE